MSDQPQGNGAPEASQGGSQPETVTMDRVAELVGRTVNQAISARYKAQDSKIERLLGDFASKFETVIGERGATSTQQDTGKTATIEESPQFRGLQKQLGELQKRAEQAEAARSQESAKARDALLRQKLAQSLADHGVDAARTKHAIGYLVDASKSVRYGDDGESLVFSSNGEELDFASGLKTWVASDDAKIYLPPRGTAGSGDKPANSNGRGNAPPDPYAHARSLVAEYFGGGSSR